MKHLLTVISFFLVVTLDSTVATSQAEGIMEGTVKLPGPSAAPLLAARYQIKNSSPIAPPDPPVAVVYLEGPFQGQAKPAPSVAQMAQKNFQFAPGILPVQKGTQVEFPNYDSDYHNVFSFSRTKRFDLGRYRKDEKPAAVLFDKPGLVKLNCEIHEHMRGAILVLDTPYFTKTDSKGVYRLEKLPTGNFMAKAWIDEKTVLERPVQIKDGETVKLDFP